MFEEINKRLWTCFICGMGFKSPESYKNHILDNHQEGREFICCPLERCGYPVRDVRAHFKAKHPSEPLPKNCQMKALLWSDPRDPRGKKKKRKITFKSGHFQSNKNEKTIPYRSGYELDVYKCLEEINSVRRYEAEPFPIPYLHNGKQANYLPDLLVEFTDGRIEIWEIKPSSQTTYKINESKWNAAARYCEKRNWKFVVKTEKGIKLLKEQVNGNL
jgi:hypothetical protein